MKKGAGKIAVIGSVFLMSILPSYAAAAPNAKEERAIAHLIEFVRKSSHIFSFNGQDYDGAGAADLLTKKYDAESSRIRVAEDFIDRTASKSITGKRYLLKRQDGSQSEVKTWLTTELSKYRSKHPF